MAKHIELIIDFIQRDNEWDLKFNDNTGHIVRCRDCKHFKNNHICEYFSRFGTIEMQEDDYCAKGEK